MAETTVTSVIDSQTVLTHMTATNKDEALQELAATFKQCWLLK